MKNKTTFGEIVDIKGREWLTYEQLNGTKGAFAFPPIKGIYRNCYQKMKADSEVVPAERLDLVLLAQGAYTQETSRWHKVKRECFVNRNVRAPMRTFWIPHKNELAGVLLERDLEGEGRTTKMQLPKNTSGWTKGENGVYESPNKNQILVPARSYKLEEHTAGNFARDGLATAILTAEGAEIFAGIAVDAKLRLCIWGLDIKDINEPEQRVVGLYGNALRLGIGGCDGCYINNDEGGSYAFGKAIEIPRAA